MPEQIIAASLQLNAEQANTSVKSFKSELKAANEELLTTSERFGSASAEAVNAAKKVAGLKDAIGDAKALADAFSPDAKFKAFGQAVSGVTGGFTALTGVMALFGTESKEVEKLLLKVQSALAIQQGLDSIMSSVDGFKNLATVIQQTTLFRKADAVATGLATAAQKLFGLAVVQSSTAFKILKGAIAATGIGLLIVAIGFLVEKLSSMKDGSESAADAQDRLAEATRRMNEATNEQIQLLDSNNKALVTRAKIAGKSEEEITALERKAIQDRITLRMGEMANAIKTGAAITDLAKANSADLQALNDFDLNQQLKKADAGRALVLKQVQEAKENFEKKQAALKQATKDEQDFQAKIAEENLKADYDRAIKENEQKLTLENIRGSEKLTGELNIAQMQIDTNKWVSDEIKLQNEEDAESFKQLQEKKKQALQDTISAAGSLLGAYSNLLGKQSKAGKAFAIAEAVINTYKSATSAFSAMSGIPIVGPALGVIAAAAAVASGIKSIKAITSVKLPGGDAGGGVSLPSLTTAAAPLTPQAPQTVSTSIDGDSINKMNNATVRAYMVEADATDAHEKITRLSRAARLGN